MELFQHMQWHCKTYHPRSLSKLLSALQCDVLLIDIDCTIGVRLPPDPEKKQELDMRDILHFILAAGYQGTIVIAHSTPLSADHIEASQPTGESVYGSTAYKLQHSNAYTDAFRVDMHVTVPLTKRSAKQIIEKYESEFLSSL